MNESRRIYLQCIKQDALALYDDTAKKRAMDPIFKYQKLLRKCEYYSRLMKSIEKRLLCYVPYIIFRQRYRRLSYKYGFAIPWGVFGPGLSIAHFGTIVVNNAAKVGSNCRIHEGVTIGSTNGSAAAPVIGNNVFIASGAKLIGDITVADDVAIGANAVVVKSINEPGTTWGGVPARKISNNNSHNNLSKYLFEKEINK